MIKEYKKRIGIFEIEIRESGILTFKKRLNNLIMNTILDEEVQIYQGVAPDLEIMHCAVGDDDGTSYPLSADNYKLGNEVYRVPVEAGPTKIDTGYLTTEFVITKSEANGETIKEIGIYVSTASEDWAAGAGADTGKLMSRVYMVPNVEKTASKEITIRRIDIVQRPTIV
jgi:hypothetical protein